MKKSGILFPEDTSYTKLPIYESNTWKEIDKEILKILYAHDPEEKSYFGGFPLFFEGETWPVHPESGNPLTFLGQVCLSDCGEKYMGACRALRIFIDLPNENMDMSSYMCSLSVLTSDDLTMKKKCSFEEFSQIQDKNGLEYPIVIPKFTHAVRDVDFIDLLESSDIFEYYVGSNPYDQSINGNPELKTIRDRAYEKADRIEKEFYNNLITKFPNIKENSSKINIGGYPTFLQGEAYEFENSNGISMPYFMQISDIVGGLYRIPGFVPEHILIYFDPNRPSEPIAYMQDNT